MLLTIIARITCLWIFLFKQCMERGYHTTIQPCNHFARLHCYCQTSQSWTINCHLQFVFNKLKDCICFFLILNY